MPSGLRSNSEWHAEPTCKLQVFWSHLFELLTLPCKWNHVKWCVSRICYQSVLSVLSRVQLFTTPWTVCSPQGSSAQGIFQARILEWGVISSSRGSSQPRDWTHISCIGRSATWEAPGSAAAAKSLQLCPTLCDPIDGSPPGSPVLGILQARTLEWVAISFSTGSATTLH